MKRILPSLLVVLLLLCGCNKRAQVKVSTTSLNLRTVISYRESVYEGIFQSDENGNCSFSFLSPDSLDGFAIIAQDGEIKMQYGDIIYNVPSSDTYASVFLYEIYEVLRDIPNKTAVNFTNEKVLYEGDINGRAYTLEFDPQGNPVSLSMKSLDLIVNFYEY